MIEFNNQAQAHQDTHGVPVNAKEMLWRIKQDFPNCFVSKPKPIQPIAIGIRETLVDYYQKVLGEDFNETLLKGGY
tara:strand:- start:288 stop:515 length:228 start_codon:yes stop_codon:yes gene_type:complete